MTFEIHQLQERLEAVNSAEDELWQSTIGDRDSQDGSSYSLLHELLQRERADVERQLADAADRVAFASMDVTLSQASAPIFVE